MINKTHNCNEFLLHWGLFKARQLYLFSTFQTQSVQSASMSALFRGGSPAEIKRSDRDSQNFFTALIVLLMHSGRGTELKRWSTINNFHFFCPMTEKIWPRASNLKSKPNIITTLNRRTGQPQFKVGRLCRTNIRVCAPLETSGQSSPTLKSCSLSTFSVAFCFAPTDRSNFLVCVILAGD